MKEYFLIEEQYCDNAFVINIVPLPLRFHADKTCRCRFAFAQKILIGPSGSLMPRGKRPVGTEIKPMLW